MLIDIWTLTFSDHFWKMQDFEGLQSCVCDDICWMIPWHGCKTQDKLNNQATKMFKTKNLAALKERKELAYAPNLMFICKVIRKQNHSLVLHDLLNWTLKLVVDLLHHFINIWARKGCTLTAVNSQENIIYKHHNLFKYI